jgi:nucleoside-diphosphate-sugar epimerase
MMERILVTGAAGYVGGEIVRQLRKLDKEVTSLYNRRAPEFTPCVKADLTDFKSLEKSLQEMRFDTIIHVASLPGDTGDPQEMIRVNVNGCLNMLEIARKMDVKRFVQTSSISAYEWYPATPFNPPEYIPVDENHPCRPKDLYSTSKRMQEELVMTYYHQYSVPTTALRLTAVIGPRGRGGGRGWGEFATMLAEGEKVQVPHFTKEEMCHYVDMRDVARMHIVAAEHPKAAGEIFNCCGPGPNRGSDFTEILQTLVSGIQVEFGYPWSMAQGNEIAFDMSKAKELLDFEPEYTLKDSLRNIKEWIDSGGLEETEAEDKAFGEGVAQ